MRHECTPICGALKSPISLQVVIIGKCIYSIPKFVERPRRIH